MKNYSITKLEDQETLKNQIKMQQATIKELQRRSAFFKTRDFIKNQTIEKLKTEIRERDSKIIRLCLN